MTDQTDQPDGRGRRTRLALIGATLALGLGALGAAATGAFADGTGSGSSTTGAATTFVQDGTTPTPEPDAPAREDCPEGAAPAQDGAGTPTTPT